MSKKEELTIFEELGYKDQADYEKRRLEPLKEHYAKQERIQELQDKAVLEGLSDEEKAEYKELRGL